MFYNVLIAVVAQNNVAPQNAIAPGIAADDDGFETDENEFNPENDVFDHIEHRDDDEEEDIEDLSARFQGKKPRYVPDETQIFVWNQARKVGSEFLQDDWKSVTQTSLVKSYNTHPEAVMFSAPLADAEVPDLKYKEKQNLEKQVWFSTMI